MDAHTRLLEVTARIYAEAGYRGTTTRRIAQEAGVNEVTLFRHFGTKEALIKAALEATDQRGRPTPLPLPETPADQLYVYATECFSHFYRNRHLIARVMADMVEHPEIAPDVCAEPTQEHNQLALYLARMRDLGMTSHPFLPEAAAGLLLGGLLTHALWRDHVPDVIEPDLVIRHYVNLVLTAVGAEGAPVPLEP